MLDSISLIEISFKKVIYYNMMFLGFSLFYLWFDSFNIVLIFSGTTFFLLGFILFSINLFNVEVNAGGIIAVLIMIASVNFLILYIKFNQKIFLLWCAGLLLTGIIIVLISSSLQLSNLLISFWLLIKNLWTVIVILIISVWALFINSKNNF